MNPAEYVNGLIQSLKEQGNVLSDVAWQTALACVGWPYVFGDRGQYWAHLCSVTHLTTLMCSDVVAE